MDVTHETSGSEPRSADDPRAGALEVQVAKERARAAMFGGAHEAPRIGRFLLLAPIGRGGMGSVFAAYDPQLDRRIAIKLVRSHARDPHEAFAIRERMLREARAMAKVSHPNVVAIHEAGVADDLPTAPVYLAMELVEGLTLRQWIAKRSRSWAEIVAVHVAAARGLAAVHAAGLVHRDFKPDNAMIDEHGRVRVMDFGLARTLGDVVGETTSVGDASRTASTRPAGTPGYIAPEQLQGEAIDHRADQYALCVSLYESLWGRRPANDGEAPIEARRTPARVRAAIQRGLSIDRERRFPSMDALATALESGRNRRWLALGLVTGATAIAAIVASLARPQPCGRDDGAIDELATPAVDAAIEQSFGATGLAYAALEATRSIAGLHAWARSWDDERERACLATRVHATQSESRLDRRMRCLARLRREAGAVARELAAADASTVDHAVAAVERLVDPARCDDDAVLDAHGVVPAESVATEVDRIDDELARAAALLELGHAAAATAITGPLVVDARATGFEPVVARAEVFAARARAHAGDLEGVVEQLSAGYFAARRTDQAEDAARAALDLAGLVSTVDAEIGVARLWLELARSDLAIHGLSHLEGIALEADAAIAQASGEWERMAELGRRQLAWIDAHCPACDERGLAHRSIAIALDNLGRAEASIEHARAALDDELGRHDPGHPHVAEARRTLGQSLGRADRGSEAIAELSLAVDALVARFGEDDLDVAVARATAARVMLENGRADEAIALLERTLRAIPQHSRSIPYAAAQHTLGSAYYWGGRLDDAARALQVAIDVQEELFPEGHPNTAVGLGELANVDFDRGRFQEALAGYERALTMRRATVGADDPVQAHLQQKIDATLEALGRADE